MIVLECALYRWSPGIGDPTVMGWVAVAAYMTAVAVAGFAGARAAFPVSSRRRERLFWLSVALVLLFLAINKQLDLQSFLTAWGRCLSQAQGWYDSRRAVQQDFVLALGGLAAAGAAGLIWFLRGTFRRSGLALCGLALLAGFVLIRAAGFHHAESLIGIHVLSARMSHVLELSGLAVIMIAGLRVALLDASQPALQPACRSGSCE